MGQPVLDADVRPTATVIKRIGTFSGGHTVSPGIGHVEVDFEFRRAAEISAVFDNMDKKLNGLTTGDYVKYEIQYAGSQHVLVFGIIQRVEFDPINATVKLEAIDHGTIGKSRDLNRELYQQFNPNVATNVTRVGSGLQSAVPADAKFDAPVTVKSRHVEGNHLRTDLDNNENHQWDPVYATSIYALGQRGGVSTLASKPNCDPYEVHGGAGRHVAQVFSVKNTGTLTNLILPLTIVRHLHENAANSGNANYDSLYAADGGAAKWNLPGIIGECMYCWQATDSGLSSYASASMIGPNELLEISLVKAVKCTESGVGATTFTPGDVTVRSGDYIPGSLNANAEFSAAAGHSYGTATGGFDVHPVTEPFMHLDGTPAIVTVSPTEPIAAPNGPVGETIKHTYKWRKMYNDNLEDAYTMFEWNFEHNPISVNAGEQIAIVVSMLGTDMNHAVGMPGASVNIDSIPVTNDELVYAKRKSACAYWGVGINKYQAQSTFGRYDEGSYMMAPFSNASNQLLGTHGEASFSILAHTPGYNSEYAQYGVWEYMANLNPQVLQMQSWNNGNVGNELNMFEFPLYDNRWNTHSMYFTAVLDGYRPLNPVTHYELDELQRLVLYGENAAIYTPIDTDYMNENIIKLDYYSNPTTNGLLNATAAASVSDMIKKLKSFIPQWDSVIVDATGDYVDDAAGVGYASPALWEFHYLSAVQTNVWDAIQEVALRSDAQVWTYHDGTNSTLVFEQLTAITDFSFDSPNNHQYTFSTRKQDPNWMKHIIKMSISRDVDNMYSRFKVVGRTDPKTQYGYNSYTKEYMEVRTAEAAPITYYLDVPEIETLIGYRREKVLTNNRNITTYSTAAEAALALKTIYGVDQWAGEITLAGLHPVMNSATLGVVFDRNAVVRIIDEHNPILDTPTGVGNVFRVTGATYNATQHTTKLRLTNLLESKPELQARRELDELRKTSSLENTGRNMTLHASSSVAQASLTSDSYVGLFDSSGAELTSLGYSRVKASIVDNDALASFQCIASFSAANGTIESQALPIKYVKVFGDGGTNNSPLIQLEDEILKWELDTFTVTIDILRS